MSIKKRMVLSLVIVAFAGIGLFAAGGQLNGPDITESVAWVNGTPISLNELQKEIKKTRDAYAMQNIFHDKSELAQLEQAVLERLIERELLWQQAAKMGISVTDEAVSAEMEEMKKQYGNEAIFNNMLNNRKLSLPVFLTLVRKDLTINALIEQEIAGGIAVSDTACRTYYQINIDRFKEPEKIRASHIGIFLDENASDAEKQKALSTIQSLEQRLRQGEPFEVLAREFSDCASSERGGDLGFLTGGTLDPAFEKAAFALKLNEVSPIVKSSMGYHIIKVTDRQPVRVIAFDEAREAIERHLLDQEIGNGVKQYLAGLRQKAEIKTAMPRL
ncbi:MAG: peptidylprolyl isomerase [Desulfobacterales bacterium]|nr:peptidylprolyl isomerase [Desulfobacterales bacterium]